MVHREVEIPIVSIFLRIVRILTRALAFVATVTTAIFGYVDYRSERGEPIGKVMLWVLENIPLSVHHWAAIAAGSGCPSEKHYPLSIQNQNRRNL